MTVVDEFVDSKLIRRVLALIDVQFSNSMIEAWWRSLKHQWLYLNTLDSLVALKRLVTFYVDEQNTKMPHSAFREQTPDEMYYGRGARVPEELDAARKVARAERVAVNREMA